MGRTAPQENAFTVLPSLAILALFNVFIILFSSRMLQMDIESNNNILQHYRVR